MKKAIPFKKHFALLTACILSAVMLTVFSLSADALELRNMASSPIFQTAVYLQTYLKKQLSKATI